MSRPAKVGVTGSAGFIGSHLCDRLLAEGREVVGIDDFSHGSPSNMSTFAAHPNFTFAELDCRDALRVRRTFAGCDALVHLAAEKIPRYGGALKTLQANVAGAESLYEAALALDAQVVVASTSDVYGNATPPFAEDDALTLGPPTTRRWAYATSKLYDEHVALAMAAEQGLRVKILRFFGSYGPRNNPSWWGGPQAAFFEILLDGKLMDIHGDGRQVRTFTFVTDTVDGVVRTLDTPEAEGEVINIGGDEPTTIFRLAHEAQAALGLSGPLRARMVPYEQIGGRYQDVRCRIPDTTKAFELLGFRAEVSLSDGLAVTAAWHRERREQIAAAGLGVASVA
ncbi:NAD-dependent epimerase/dehydratase family protein [Baekduia soli]|uniref:NAD-dependent epimerase/dehydratase family protein n=1 Tax=Baekduia soli TaxID=496014 RepID=A0A5B8UAT5_9ACTN|nr:NAD-dependent epimerase/dehydratase family protein [Baekduia soli]QEC50094.1 NAD-dependent epimerase/dehydratase family protein [Baekduia soli]